MTNENIDDHVRERADGLFSPLQQDLLTRLVKELAEIDSDHISRGFYGSSMRLSVRHEARMLALRTILKHRVQSVVQTYDEASRLLDSSAARFTSMELRRIAAQWLEQLLAAAKKDTEQSRLGGGVSEQLCAAVRRDITVEHERAADFLRAEIARHELVRPAPPKEGWWARNGPENPRAWFWRIAAALAVATLTLFFKEPLSGLFKPANTHAASTDAKGEPITPATIPGASLALPLSTQVQQRFSSSRSASADIELDSDGILRGTLVLENDAALVGFSASARVDLLNDKGRVLTSHTFGEVHIQGKPPGKAIRKKAELRGRIESVAALASVQRLELHLLGGD